MVEDNAGSSRVIVSHQTVTLWAEKIGRHFSNDIRKRSAGRLGEKWHLDEVVITMGGKKHWLWTCWCKAVAMPRLPNGWCESF
jgi:putative transposase